jgi:hypothetical protein
MNGYKTYIGIILAFLSLIGYGDLINEEQIGNLVDIVTGFIGIALTVYGNYKAHKEIKALGGYRK